MGNNFMVHTKINPRIFIYLVVLILAIVVLVAAFSAQKIIFQVSSQDNTQEILNEIRGNLASYISSEGTLTFLGNTFGDVFDSLEGKHGEAKVRKTTDGAIAITFQVDEKLYITNWICSDEDCLLQSVNEGHTLHQREKALKVLDRLQFK